MNEKMVCSLVNENMGHSLVSEGLVNENMGHSLVNENMVRSLVHVHMGQNSKS